MLRSLSLLVTGIAVVAADPSDAQRRAEFFEQAIRPVLVEQCHRCHAADNAAPKGGLRLDSREALLRGGESGPAVTPGAPDRSLILRAIAYEDPDLQMPPRTRLSADVVGRFRRWIEDGAVWPEAVGNTTASPGQEGFNLAARRQAHWAWQPLRNPAPPDVRDRQWPKGPVDAFILARLEAAGLKPAPVAERRALIRRASFALTGLPPSPETVEAFVKDPSADAFAQVVDRLLASPHFGEHWARHWLDKVRYAETFGHEFDYPILGAWRYRDYVVRAFNQDLPYDEFAREQIAGDLVERPRRSPLEGHNESLVATTHFWLSQQVHSPVDVRQHQADVVDNQLDVITKAFLGLTVACARCHDHKFDAISTKDYYALFGILGSSRHAIRAVDDPTPRRALAAALVEWRTRLRRQLAAGLERAWATVPPDTSIAASLPELRPDERELPLAEWFADGEAFTADPGETGQPMLREHSGDLRVEIIPAGWRHSASLSRRFQGALRSPAFVIAEDFVHLRVAGEGTRVSVLVEGFTLIRAPIYGGLRQPIQQERPHWLTVDLSRWRGRRASIEFADFHVLDPASELGAEAASPNGWLAVGAAVLSPHREPPSLRAARLPSPAPDTLRRWAESPGQLSAEETEAIQRWVGTATGLFRETDAAEFRRLEQRIPEPVLAGVAFEADGWDEPVFIRGNPKKPGENVPRRFLEALRPPSADDAVLSGSGRSQLAAALTRPDNPLFARVMVNWVWSHLFGRGLVATPDNFGALGDAPTHPELLDWLATDFIRSGWSTKRLIRQITLSRTWQMRSHAADPESDRVDPENRLLHRAHLRRLQAESLRDAMLALSGALDPALGGPPVAAHLTPHQEGRGRPGISGPLDGDGRRSLYLEVRRNFLSPFLMAFDAPVPATTVGRRSVSNVPAQALALMNDPFVAAQARSWAVRALRECPGAPGPRLERLYLQAFARPPTREEHALGMTFVTTRQEGPGGDELTAWSDYCHVLINLKEFLYLP